MLKKRLGVEGIERVVAVHRLFKVPSTLIIPEGCKSIRFCSFQGCCRKLKKVIIPRSVEKIGEWAFWGCDNAEIILKKAKSEFKEIGYQAFGDCKYVKEETGD